METAENAKGRFDLAVHHGGPDSDRGGAGGFVSAHPEVAERSNGAQDGYF